MDEHLHSGETINEPTPPEHEGDDWRVCEEGDPECGEFEQWEAL